MSHLKRSRPQSQVKWHKREEEKDEKKEKKEQEVMSQESKDDHRLQDVTVFSPPFQGTTPREDLFAALEDRVPSMWNIRQVYRVDHFSSGSFLRCLIFDFKEKKISLDTVRWLRREFVKCFLIVYEPRAASDPEARLSYFDCGVNMVAHDVESILEILRTVVLVKGGGSLSCPYCNFYDLTEDELRRHIPAYHINSRPTYNVRCPICRKFVSGKTLQVHIHDDHGAAARARNGGEMEEQAAIRSYSFSLVVCRHPLSGLFLLCQEFCGQGFWLPGGAVDAGESYATAAHRETMEEAGVEITLKGILRIEHSPSKTGPKGGYYVRQRVIYFAEPKDVYNCVPKSIPDFESAGACWVSLEDMENLKLRGQEPLQWARYLQRNGTVYPLEIFMEKK